MNVLQQKYDEQISKLKKDIENTSISNIQDKNKISQEFLQKLKSIKEEHENELKEMKEKKSRKKQEFKDN